MKIVSGLLLSFGSFVIAGNPAFAQANELEIVNIRIGQGDATLIRGPQDASGKRVVVLFDAGDDARSTDADYEGGKIVSAVLKRRGISHIDYVVISHYDEDHIGGLIIDKGRKNASVLFGPNSFPGAKGDDDGNGQADWADDDPQNPYPREYGKGDDITVGTFVDRGDEQSKTSGQQFGTPPYKLYVSLAKASGNRISLDTQSKLDDFSIDLGGGAKMLPYASAGRIRGGNEKVADVNTENEHSVSMLVTYGKFDFLVSGDLIGQKHSQEDAKVERAVGAKLQAEGKIVDVLHVNHHGANNGSDSVFLEQIKPTIAVISHGNVGSYKHPNILALKRLEAAKVYRIVQTKWGTTELSVCKTKQECETVRTNESPVRDIQAVYQNDVVITSDGQEYTVSTSRKFTADSNPRRPSN